MEEEQSLSKAVLEELGNVKKILNERLEAHENTKKVVQNRLNEICAKKTAQIDGLEKKITSCLEAKNDAEENRIETVITDLQENESTEVPEEISKALQKAKAELLVAESFELIEGGHDEPPREESQDEGNWGGRRVVQEQEFSLVDMYELKAEKKLVLEAISSRSPSNVQIKFIKGQTFLQADYLNQYDIKVLSEYNLWNKVKFICLLCEKGVDENQGKEYTLQMLDGFLTFAPGGLKGETTYGIRVKTVAGEEECGWSDEVEFTTPEFKECCVWKKLLYYISVYGRYTVDEENPRIATMVGDFYRTIIGNAALPSNKVISWSIKILNSRRNDGDGIYVGVAPSDIDQNEGDNHKKCGWYFNCFYSTLWSGPPHYYWGKEYGPRKEKGKYVHTGDSVGVVMDTTKGELSFALNGVNLGVAYGGIPRDKPLVPCVLLDYEGDSVKLVI